MAALSEFLAGLGHWNWFFLGLLLVALETFVPGVHFLWFGVAALIVGAAIFALAAVGAGDVLTLPWQLVLFAVISVGAVFWVRSMSRAEQAETDEPDLNQRGAQYSGRVVVVEEAIAGGRGRVRVGDTLWAAQGPDAAKGASVRVKGSDGTVLIVELVSDSAGRPA